MKQSVNPTTAIIVVIVLVIVVAVIGWQVTKKRPAVPPGAIKLGVGPASQGSGGPPPGSPMFKGDPSAVPASGMGGPASGGVGGGGMAPPPAAGPEKAQPTPGQ